MKIVYKKSQRVINMDLFRKTIYSISMIFPQSARDRLKFLEAIIEYPSRMRMKSKMHKLYSKFIVPRDLAFDIGANNGIITEILLKSKAKIISVEPLPTCLKRLKTKFKNNANVVVWGGSRIQTRSTQILC